MYNEILGYKVHNLKGPFFGSTILFSNGHNSITVEMAIEAVNYMLGQIIDSLFPGD